MSFLIEELIARGLDNLHSLGHGKSWAHSLGDLSPGAQDVRYRSWQLLLEEFLSNGRNTIGFLGNQEETEVVKDQTTVEATEKMKFLFNTGKDFATSMSDYYVC